MSSGAVSFAPHPEAARANRFLANLPLNAYALLASHLRTVELQRGAVLHDVGEPIEYVYFLHSGVVSIVTIMRDGASVETATVGRAGVIGATAAFGGRRALGRAVVQLPGTASRISGRRLHAAVQESGAIHDLAVRYNDLSTKLIQQSVACAALHMLEARLCRWLLQTHDCVDGDIVPLTQEFLGQTLGVRRTSVSFTARLLQSAGMIRYCRGHIQIVDRARLEQSACECYAVIREHTDDMFPVMGRPGVLPRYHTGNDCNVVLAIGGDTPCQR